MKAKPTTFSDLLDNWSILELSADLGVPYINARLMKRRKSVGVSHWPKLVKAAAAKGIIIDTDDLVTMRSMKAAA